MLLLLMMMMMMMMMMMKLCDDLDTHTAVVHSQTLTLELALVLVLALALVHVQVLVKSASGAVHTTEGAAVDDGENYAHLANFFLHPPSCLVDSSLLDRGMLRVDVTSVESSFLPLRGQTEQASRQCQPW